MLLLQEIVAALEGSCNIIPVMDNFQWPLPETLPDDMRAICYFNSIRCVGLQYSLLLPEGMSSLDTASDDVCNIYIRHVNGVKLAEIMFSLARVCVSVSVSVRPQSLDPIGLNGRNDVLYSTRA